MTHAAKKYGMDVRTIIRLINEKKLTAYKSERSQRYTFISPTELENLLFPKAVD
ncbi:hypothetical protein [Corynebacterium auriscanis]|nr:hypothetical protein [Corynebacterium auriscanis]